MSSYVCPRLFQLKQQESPEHCPVFHLSTLTFTPFVTLDFYSSLNPFILGFEVARPDHLISVSSHHGHQIFDRLALLDLDQCHGHTQRIRSEAEQIRIFSSCTTFPGHFPWVLHLQIAEHGYILYRNPGCNLLVKRH